MKCFFALACALIAFGAAGCTREKPSSTAQAPTLVALQTATLAIPTVMQIPTVLEPGSSAPTTYTVQWGDWLSKIAAQFGVTTQAIVAANPGLNPNRVYPGQVLIIPGASATALPPTPGSTGGATPRASPSAAPGPESSRTPTDGDARPPSPTSSAGPTTYTVQRGDWLYAIARKFGVSVPALQAANPGVNLSIVYPGQVLNIPGSGTPTTTPALVTPGNPASYVVQPGDTLFSIAVRFHTTTYALQIANHLASQNFIFVGQVLEIPKVHE